MPSFFYSFLNELNLRSMSMPLYHAIYRMCSETTAYLGHAFFQPHQPSGISVY